MKNNPLVTALIHSVTKYLEYWKIPAKISKRNKYISLYVTVMQCKYSENGQLALQKINAVQWRFCVNIMQGIIDSNRDTISGKYRPLSFLVHSIRNLTSWFGVIFNNFYNDDWTRHCHMSGPVY